MAATDTCLTAPKGAGPKGSRWYYRIEWPAQRKCWHLVLNDKRQKTAVKAEPQVEADADDETGTTPAPAANAAPVASTAPERTAEPQAAPAPAPAAPRVQTLITRNVSNTEDTAQPAPWPDPSAKAAPAPQEQTPATLQQSEPAAPAAIVAPPAPQPVAAAEPANRSGADSTMTWRLLFAAIALLGFAGAAALIVVEVMRRRRDVLNVARGADVSPEDWRDAEPAEDPPTFAPLPPMGVARDDDVEEAVRRFVRNSVRSSRRRAA